MIETDMACSPSINRYFEELENKTQEAYAIAQKARKKGFDPEDYVEITLAKNMAERVVGIIAFVAPQIIGSGVVERIIELEKEYSSQDWRVAFKIAHEIAQEKFCTFEDKKEAIEVGIRTGFAYVTVGVVSAPLEGLTSIDIKPRRDGKGEYFRLNYSGPIRNAGGTAAATSVLIADYVRKQMGYAKYDPDEKEIRRCYAELEDYHQYVANLQYFPFKEETEFLLENIPVEIAGDPSEKRELSNASLKDLKRVETNFLRSGYCLIHSSCIPLKAPKLWKQLGKWGKDFGMDDWNFLEKHIKFQKELKAKDAENTQEEKTDNASEEKVKPDATFVKDLVGGRPVLAHPMRSGGFRLRYGRGRASGYSGQSIHPATMSVLDDFIATGTQLKVERPGKAAAFTPCDTIRGPIVKLNDGSVLYISSEEEGNKITKEVKEILYLGDVLVNYGDFFDRAHMLIPSGYSEEYWLLELKKAIDEEFSEQTSKEYKIDDAARIQFCTKTYDIDENDLKKIFEKPHTTKISYEMAKKLSLGLNIPLHPEHIFFYKEINTKQLLELVRWLSNAEFFLEIPKINIPLKEEFKEGKRALELLGVPHKVKDETVSITGETVFAISETLQIKSALDAKHIEKIINEQINEGETESLKLINIISPVIIKDLSGIFIGGRMGRPEKAKMRKMTGSPHGLFPVGNDGGRLRSFQSALIAGKVTSLFPVFLCPQCKNRTPFSICDMCETKTIRQKIDWKTGEEISPEEAEKHPDKQYSDYKEWNVPIKDLFSYCLKKMDTKIYPDLIKGVRGTVGRDKTPEHLLKAILRAKNDVAVNKDGTIRFDASEITLTHFKPKEIGTSINRLKQLGYKKDVYGKTLENENQVLELRAQDVVLPASDVSPDKGSAEILLNATKFIDEELQQLYNLPAYYNAKKTKDLIGQLIIGLAPHTSAGMIGRIIGFSKTQGFLAHPLYHAAMRRDCDGDESCAFLLMDAFLNFSQKFLGTSRGSTMDAPIVLTTLLNPAEVDDMAFNVDIVDKYPLEFYKACEEYKYPWDIKIKQINNTLFTEEQFEGMMFTHDTDNINSGVLCSAYKTIPSMKEKIDGQMALAKKIRAVDTTDVARLIIEKHFIRDTKGNLRKFSLQKFRCVHCNEKYRRPPLVGKCTTCGGKIIFTISEGSIIKYMQMSINLAEEYNVSPYLKETLQLTQKRILDVFGKEKEKQTSLTGF